MAVLDLLSIEESRLAIGARGDNQTAWLDQLTTALSERIDQLCGPVIGRTVTDTYDGGRLTIALRQRPVLSITSVVEYRGTVAAPLTYETAGTAPVDGYWHDRVSGILTRRTAGATTRFASGPHVTVVYQAGRCADTASVPQRFKVCASIALAHLWEQAKGKGDPQFGGDETFRNYMLPFQARDFVKNDLLVAIA